MKVNQVDYIDVFNDKSIFDDVKKSEEALSLFQHVEVLLDFPHNFSALMCLSNIHSGF